MAAQRTLTYSCVTLMCPYSEMITFNFQSFKVITLGIIVAVMSEVTV